MSYSVARTVMGRATISTVKLDFTSKEIHAYETMIFKDNDESFSGYQGKSSNLQEARHEHVLAIQYLLMKEYLKGENNDKNNDNQ